MKTEAVPVTVGALGLIRKGMNQNSGKIPGASNISELQKIILLGTTSAHILTVIRDGSRVKNPMATATWPDTDKNDNQLRYSYKLKYYTLCEPLKNCMTPCQKILTGTLHTVQYLIRRLLYLEGSCPLKKKLPWYLR